MRIIIKMTFRLSVLVLLLLSIWPSSTQAATTSVNCGLVAVASPSLKYDQETSTKYALPGETYTFKVFYCGNPNPNGEISASKLTNIQFSVGSVARNKSITNYLQKNSESGNCQCSRNGVADNNFYGTPAVFSWPVQSSDQGVKQLVFKNSNGTSSSATITVGAPPDDAIDYSEIFQSDISEALSNKLNLGNISSIFDELRPNPLLTTPEGIAKAIISIMLLIAGILALIAFIWSGYQLLTSGGDSGKAEKAKKSIIWAVIGLLVIIFAQYLISVVNVFEDAPDDEDIGNFTF